MNYRFSIIIPVYNRPEELSELLESLSIQSYDKEFEIIVIEDGSARPAKDVIDNFQQSLSISYLIKQNSGPGLSRNYGMQRSTGNYFIILDSDVILPANYLQAVDQRLQAAYTDFFGGPDAAHDSFSPLQKAINYSMTSVLTTGGLRGKKQTKNFQPRSFNMGISKKAFEDTGGFSAQHFGEDIDLTFRLWQAGYKSQFIEEAFVYHKRRTTLRSFFRQTFNFGAARPILNEMYPASSKITYWFPTLFTLGLLISIVARSFGWFWPALVFGCYYVVLFFDSFIKNSNVLVPFMSIITTTIQFFGYGLGFLRSVFRLKVQGQSMSQTFPRMFN